MYIAGMRSEKLERLKKPIFKSPYTLPRSKKVKKKRKGKKRKKSPSSSSKKSICINTDSAASKGCWLFRSLDPRAFQLLDSIWQTMVQVYLFCILIHIINIKLYQVYLQKLYMFWSIFRSNPINFYVTLFCFTCVTDSWILKTHIYQELHSG